MTVAALAIVIAGVAPLTTSAQNRPAASSIAQAGVYPVPANLTVLPRNLTGRQVNDIMEKWNVELGVRCSACHVRESDGIVSGGGPRRGFEDDSKPMKQIARIMYAMTAEINRKFMVGDDGAPGPVTCATCHRGNIRPEQFISPADSPSAARGASVSGSAPISR